MRISTARPIFALTAMLSLAAPGIAAAQTTVGPNAAKATAGQASTLNNRTIAPGTREDFEHPPQPHNQPLFYIGSLPVTSHATVPPAYNGAGTYATVAGEPANGKRAFSAAMLQGSEQGAPIESVASHRADPEDDGDN